MCSWKTASASSLVSRNLTNIAGVTPRRPERCQAEGNVELLTVVNIALGNAPAADCLSGDPSSDRQINVDEIVSAVNNALGQCP